MLARLLTIAVLLPVLAFCAFGLLATFEPGDAATRLIWRLSYIAVGLACLAGIIVAALVRRRPTA